MESETTETADTGAPLSDEQIEADWGEGVETHQAEPPASETASQETVSQADGEEGEGEGEPAEGEPESDPYAEPPEFWPADRKALWDSKQIPQDVRQAIHDHVAEASRATSKRMMELSEQEKSYKEQLGKYEQDHQQFGQYLERMVPAWVQTFRSKYEGVDEVKFAREDPAAYAAWQAERNRDAALLQQAENARQFEARAAQQRQAQEMERNRAAEHAKLAASLPQYFGGDKAQQTYDALEKYLLAQGIPAERIAQTYEAPIVAIAHKAMLYDNAQAALKAKPPGQPATATQTSRRIAPGPGSRPGNSKGDAQRQAEQRLRSGQDLSESDIERLFG